MYNIHRGSGVCFTSTAVELSRDQSVHMGHIMATACRIMLCSSCRPNVQASCATRMHRSASEIRDNQCRKASTHTHQVHAAELDGDTKLSTWGEGCIESGVASGTKRYCRPTGCPKHGMVMERISRHGRGEQAEKQRRKMVAGRKISHSYTILQA
jgi:hypothetical protein